MKKFLLVAIMAVVLLQVEGAYSHAKKQKIAAKDSTEAKADTAKCCADTTKKAAPSAYDKLLKDGGSEREGMFTVRHIKDDWYFEVPDSMLNRLLLVVTRFSAVPENFSKLSGEEVGKCTVYFDQYNDKTLFLRQYVQSQFAKPGDKIAIALKKSTIDPVVYKFDVIGRNPKTKAQLIDVSKLFLSDNNISGISSTDRMEVNIGSLSSDRTFVDTVKTYPINVEVQTTRTYSANRSGKMPASESGYLTLGLNTSIVMLPKVPMQARLADDRVGYFDDKFTEFSDNQQVTEQESIISRYRLEPKDPARYRRGQLTEPKKQIVYYIDPATPKKWVPYLKAGINDWNKAFEHAGFKNAIVAKDWPNDSTMSLDDARFCVLRYLPSESQNAYGPHIVDPRSGEIIESHICWYHNVLNLLKRWYMVQCGPLDPRARKMTFDDKLMGELVRFVSSHEVGHTLGLRHNMCASSATPVEKLRDKKWVEAHGHTVSIMDYARFNYVAQPEDGISEKGLFPRINDYDLWAIKWGYQYRPEFKDPFAEKKVLRAEVTRVLRADSRMRYCGDEGKGPDPSSQTEDLGDDAMKASDYGIKNLKRVMANILQWTAQPDGQYDDLENIYTSVRGQYIKYVDHVQKNLTGVTITNLPDRKPKDYLPRQRYKEEVEWMGRNVYEAPLWLFPDDVVCKLKKIDAPDLIRNRQITTLTYALAPGVLYNVHNAALNSSDPYPLSEYLNDVFATIWKPLNEKDGRQNSYRRQLQRAYVNCLGGTLNPDKKDMESINYKAFQSDAVLYVAAHLTKVENYVKEQIPNYAAGTINHLHYTNLFLMIKKIKDKYTQADKD